LAFVSPWLFGFLAFVAYPIGSSIYYSLARYDVLRPPAWVGLRNYRELIFDDTLFRTVLWNTLYFVVLAVPLGSITAFVLAVLLNAKIRLRPLFRTIFYIPSVVPAVASAMLWLHIFDFRIGLLNNVLVSLGLQRVPWLSSPAWAKPSLIMIHCWTCGTGMLIYLAALQDVPRALYDAAKVDGANAWHRFCHVTVPMVTPAILFNLLMGIIGALQYFTFPWILTGGGPNYATEFYALYLYRNAFGYLRMGYASAMAWILFVISLLVALALFKSSARWVYYGGTTE
jgi:multiple sugar transport system permease protein